MNLVSRVRILYSILNRSVHHQLRTGIGNGTSAPIVGNNICCSTQNSKFTSGRLLRLQNIRAGLFDDDGRGRMGHARFGRHGTR